MSFTVSKAGTTNAVGYAARDNGDDSYTFSNRRYFVSFDLTDSGLTVDDIVSVSLLLRVTATSGGGDDIECYSGSSGDNWGTALAATSADFHSTRANSEDTQSVTSTGTKTWDIDKNNLDLDGVNWFSVVDANEFAPATYAARSITFSSANATTNKPILRITLSAAVKDFIAMGIIPFAR